MSEEMFDEIKDKAWEAKKSMNQYILDALRYWVPTEPSFPKQPTPSKLTNASNVICGKVEVVVCKKCGSEDMPDLLDYGNDYPFLCNKCLKEKPTKKAKKHIHYANKTNEDCEDCKTPTDHTITNSPKHAMNCTCNMCKK